MTELWAIVTSVPGTYIIGDIAYGFGYQYGNQTITLNEPLVIKVKGTKLVIEEYDALEGNVTFPLSNSPVGKLKKSLYAPVIQYRELKASGKSFEEMAKDISED
jgi:hypothetical protein